MHLSISIVFFVLLAINNAKESSAIGNATFVSSNSSSTNASFQSSNETISQRDSEHLISIFTSEMSPIRSVNSEEYGRFLDSLARTEEVRRSKFDRLNLNRNRNKPSSSSLEFRKFNYTADVLVEEFDCDLNLLTECESSLLEKIEKIEDHHVIFPVSTPEEVATSQEDILELCRSIDHEFQCLYDYAEKCEHKMTAATFCILKYVITKNNETIISCRQKERDWLGWEGYQDEEPDFEHEINILPVSFTPCISEMEIFDCVNRTFGFEFDSLKQRIKTREECDRVVRFERCLKEVLFERNPKSSCSLQEKEVSIQYLLNMIHFDISNIESPDYAYCQNIADRINRQFNYQKNEVQSLKEDRAFQMTDMLRFYYNSIQSEKCQQETVAVNELCYSRFEDRLRSMWDQEDVDGKILWPDKESDMLCCSTAELSTCMSTFVLIYCGLEQYRIFREEIERLRLISLPEDCGSKWYGGPACRATLG